MSFKSKFNVNFGFSILVLFCTVQVVRSQTCPSIVEFEENEIEKIGRFQVEFENSTRNSFLQVTVFVTDDCQKNSCSLISETNVKNTGKLYKEGLPLTYKVVFRNGSKNATITHIGIKTSHNCTAICSGSVLKSTAKSIKYSFYPSGRENALTADCDASELFSNIKPRRNQAHTPDNINELPLDEFCGIVPGQNSLTQLTVGGTEIERGSWPWLVALLKESDYGITFLCGATLTSERLVITAAHCVVDSQRDDLILVMGRHNRVDLTERGPQYRVHYMVINSEYRSGSSNFDADIAFLVTDRDVGYTDLIRPLSLIHI